MTELDQRDLLRVIRKLPAELAEVLKVENAAVGAVSFGRQ